MIILQGHIENFGKINNYDFKFKDGLNVILEKNGWGKTTLATFIRVMFFGFENEAKRSETENERRRYMPWQKGVYGGSITFSLNDKEYRIERTFGGKKSGSDTFTLFDNRTNLVCDDYSENIGEELFLINSESFLKTIFISQETCETEVTAGINAKIGNIAESTDDMSKYQIVQDYIKKQIDALTPTRKTGEIKKLNERISLIKAEVQNKDIIENTVLQLNNNISRLNKEIEEKTGKQKVIQEKTVKIGKQKEKMAVIEKYKMLNDSYKIALEEEKAKRACFPADVPRKENVDAMILKCVESERAKQSEENFRMSEEDIEALKKYNVMFANGRPDQKKISEMIDLCSEYTLRKQEIEIKKAKADLLKDERKKSKTGSIDPAIPVAGVIIVFFGILLLALEHFVPGTVLLVTGVLIGFFGLLYKKTPDKTADNYGYEIILNEIKADEKYIEASDMQIKEYIKNYYDDDEVSEKGYQIMLFELKNAIINYEELRKRYERYAEAGKRSSELISSIKEYISSIGFVHQGENYNKVLNDIRNLISDYENAVANRKKAENALSLFESENDVKSLSGDVKDIPEESIEELNRAFESVGKEIKEINDNISAYRKQLDNAGERLETIEAYENEMDILSEKVNVLMHKYGILTKTSEYLEKAKINFTARYMDPIKKSFDRYYFMIAGEDEKIYELDANLGLAVREAGALHDIRLLSEGYRNLVGLCRRMSMIDAMYTGKKPFIIMDDPFEGMDDSNTRGAIEFLKGISEHYQIVYLTCHSSRKP